jgi:calcineurin-like phosphoesterase family protein
VSGQQGEVALLHGHIHQHWRGQKKPGRLPEVNVGVDAWNGAPVCGETLVATFREIQGQGEDGTLGIYGNWLPA